MFSSLSESGFIPTPYGIFNVIEFAAKFSSLSESGFIPTSLFSSKVKVLIRTRFSSLSESGFIPTPGTKEIRNPVRNNVLISFREWLHSY